MKKLTTKGFVLLILVFSGIHLAAFLSGKFKILLLFYFLFTLCAVASILVKLRESKRKP